MASLPPLVQGDCDDGGPGGLAGSLEPGLLLHAGAGQGPIWAGTEILWLRLRAILEEVRLVTPYYE